MPDIITVLACLRPGLDPPTRRQLRRITEARLAMTGRVPMRGIARWAGPGGSYRTVQRCCHTSLSWGRLQWMMSRHHLLEQDDVMVLAGDDVIVTKAGQQTPGLGRFVSSLYGKQVPGRGCLSLSLLSVKRRTSYPVMLEQRARPHTETPPEVAKPTSHGQRGRPPGSKNQHRREVVLSPYRRFVQEAIKRLLELIGDHFQVIYFVFAGAFGHTNARQMVRQVRLQVISKLRYDAALYFSYDGPYAGRGKRKKYGKKLDYPNIDAKHLQESSVEKDIETKIYQMT